MPRPRFFKLDFAKREIILEAAAKEFSAHGFDGASLNRILNVAGISKGAAYYYFDDKADLFATTLHHFFEQMISGVDFDIDKLTKRTFWKKVYVLYKSQFEFADKKTWLPGLGNALHGISEDVLANSTLMERFSQLKKWPQALLTKGLEVGAIRNDLPMDLLISMVAGLDNASDRWLFDNWDQLKPDELSEIIDTVFSMIHAVVAPPKKQGKKAMQ